MNKKFFFFALILLYPVKLLLRLVIHEYITADLIYLCIQSYNNIDGVVRVLRSETNDDDMHPSYYIHRVYDYPV